VPLDEVPVAGNALRHVQAGALAGCPTHLLMTGKSEHLRGPVGAVGAMTTPLLGLPEGTHLHEDLSAFADWLLAQAPTTPQ
jgi:D-glycero-D-manno-heptose 1,7-bisphosphate phosphatase